MLKPAQISRNTQTMNGDERPKPVQRNRHSHSKDGGAHLKLTSPLMNGGARGNFLFHRLYGLKVTLKEWVWTWLVAKERVRSVVPILRF